MASSPAPPAHSRPDVVSTHRKLNNARLNVPRGTLRVHRGLQGPRGPLGPLGPSGSAGSTVAFRGHGILQGPQGSQGPSRVHGVLEVHGVLLVHGVPKFLVVLRSVVLGTSWSFLGAPGAPSVFLSPCSSAGLRVHVAFPEGRRASSGQ